MCCPPLRSQGHDLVEVPASHTLLFEHSYTFWVSSCGCWCLQSPPPPLLLPLLPCVLRPLVLAAHPCPNHHPCTCHLPQGNHRKLRVTQQPNVTLSWRHLPPRCRRARSLLLGPLMPEVRRHRLLLLHWQGRGSWGRPAGCRCCRPRAGQLQQAPCKPGLPPMPSVARLPRLSPALSPGSGPRQLCAAAALVAARAGAAAAARGLDGAGPAALAGQRRAGAGAARAQQAAGGRPGALHPRLPLRWGAWLAGGGGRRAKLCGCWAGAQPSGLQETARPLQTPWAAAVHGWLPPSAHPLLRPPPHSAQTWRRTRGPTAPCPRWPPAPRPSWSRVATRARTSTGGAGRRAACPSSRCGAGGQGGEARGG